MHLSDKALLAHLGVSQWVAKKLDRAASNQVAKMNNAISGAGNYNKSLLPTCTRLEAVKSKTSIIRKKFYANTLPWSIEGTFVLPAANYLEFVTEFRHNKAEWWELVNDFLDHYAQSCRDAQRLLGTLYNQREYPILPDLKNKFRMNIDILPVPTAGDFRVELIDEEYDAIKADIEERVADSMKVAMEDVWKRLYDRVQWLSDRLADPSRTFHDDTYRSAQETCALLTRLNITNDPNLEALRQEVEVKLVSHHPDALRNDPDLRQDTAAECQVIMDKMAVFMGDGS